ncbi:MAG: hypothetical protein RJA36_3888 [Pseudomonadota bacterium]|jgi:membrane protein implicated in regulation of membrane protease activity
MSDSTWWWLLAGVAVAVELLSGTFFLLMLALGLAAGALAAHAGAVLSLQLAVAAVVGGGAVLAWARWRRLGRPAPDAGANPDLNLDIGVTLQIEHWNPDGSAHVRHRGADWVAVLSDPADIRQSGRYRIVAVRGSQLVVHSI